MMRWLLLISSILCEVAGTSALKMASQGGRHASAWGIAVAILYLSCFWLLGLTMRHFDLGLVYAIWSGVGVTLTALIGLMFFGDTFSSLKLVSIILIVLGVVGLSLSGSTS